MNNQISETIQVWYIKLGDNEPYLCTQTLKHSDAPFFLRNPKKKATKNYKYTPKNPNQT